MAAITDKLATVLSSQGLGVASAWRRVYIDHRMFIEHHESGPNKILLIKHHDFPLPVACVDVKPLCVEALIHNLTVFITNVIHSQELWYRLVTLNWKPDKALDRHKAHCRIVERLRVFIKQLKSVGVSDPDLDKEIKAAVNDCPRYRRAIRTMLKDETKRKAQAGE